MSTEFVLDCTATLPWIFASEATTSTDCLLDRLSAGAKAWVPSLWHLELGNVLLGAQRHGRIDRAGIEKFFSSLAVYDIEVDSETNALAWSKTFASEKDLASPCTMPPTWSLPCVGACPLRALDGQLRAVMKKAGGSLVL